MNMRPALRLIDGRSSNYVTVPAYSFDEARIEAAVARDESIAHTAMVRTHLRAAMRALSESRYGLAGTWLMELERLNEQSALRARSLEVQAEPCPDCQDCLRLPGHGRAA